MTCETNARLSISFRFVKLLISFVFILEFHVVVPFTRYKRKTVDQSDHLN